MAQITFTLIINGSVTITSGSPPSGEVGVSYSFQFAATGGSGSYLWSVLSGTLPAGLTLSGGGLLAGTPTTAGTSPNITVQVASV